MSFAATGVSSAPTAEAFVSVVGLAAGVAFHLGTMVFMGLWTFGLAMIAVLLLYLRHPLDR